MEDVFTSIAVYPHQASVTLIEWQLHPLFGDTDPGPYTFTLQMSRSGNPSGDDWIDIKTITDSATLVLSNTDDVSRTFSVTEQWFYRIKLVTDLDTYYSFIEAAWGTLDKRDKLILREAYRQECLRLVKKVGTPGLLLKRKNWGVYSTEPGVIDPDTEEVTDAQSSDDYGTGFEGGYWAPFSYWVEIKANSTRKIDQSQVGTTDNRIEKVHALAWPLPRTNDVWINCKNNKRYYIGEVTITTRQRHIPVSIDFDVKEATPTDAIYKLIIDE